MLQKLNLSELKIEGKSMPYPLPILIPHLKSLAAPLAGFSGYFMLLEFSDLADKPAIAIAAAIIIAFLSYLGIRANAQVKVQVAGLETKVKERDVTETSDISKTNIALEIFDRAILESGKARDHFSEQLKEQREHFSEKSIEEHERFFNQLKETRDHYEEKEQRLREDYHTRLKDASKVSERANTNYYTLILNLQKVGITVDSNNNLILPKNFERRKSDDSSNS